MRIRIVGWACLGLAVIGAGVPAVATAQTAQPTVTREALQQQLDAQLAKNEELRQRIAKLEQVLKTDVCSNPEAEALLKAEQQAAPR